MAENGEKSERTIEPLKILFKGMGWYLYGFCRSKKDFRVFKLSRMKNLVTLEEKFERAIPESVLEQTDHAYQLNMLQLKLKIDAHLAFRVYDSFQPEEITKNEDGSFLVNVLIPEGDWLFGFLLSFGSGVQVLEPREIRQQMIECAENILKKYH